jgi:2'-5' RNA ligase
MPNVVIVALPSENDYVNKISSEKVAHLTILFLGDLLKVQNLGKIIGFTKHASDQTLTRFTLEVDRRGVLGLDLADVLFFKKSKWSGFEEINSFRSSLLQENNIRTAYDSVQDQFSEWIPHLTLGYPATPAKEDTRDYPGIDYVSFDRISVWVKDLEGIEFPLKSYDDEMIQSAINKVLERG